MAIRESVIPVVSELIKVGNFNKVSDGVSKYAANMLELDVAQQKVALSARGLSAAQQKLVLARSQELSVLQGLTVSEATNTLGLKKRQVAIFGNAEANKHLTAEMIRRLVVEGNLTAEQMKIIARLHAETVATNAQTAANAAAAGSFDAVGASAKAAFAAMAKNPLTWISLAPLAISLVSKLYDYISKAAERAKETADELHSAFEETASKLESVNTELKTSESRLKELQALSDAGTITLVEQEELDNLREEINLLERRKSILDEQAKNEAAESDEALVEAFNKQRFEPIARERYSAERDSMQEQFDALVSEGDIEAANKLYDRIVRLNDILTSGYDYTTDTYLDKKLGFRDYIDELIDTYNNADHASDLFERTRKELVEAASKLQTDWLDNLEVDKETRASWQGLFDAIDKCINPAEHFTKVLNDLPDAPKSRLEELGKSGALTAEQVEELAEKFPELKTWMDASGYTAEETASHYNALSAASSDAAKEQEKAVASLTEILDALSTVSSNIESLSKVLGEFQEEGKVSVDALSGLSDELKNLSSFDDFVNVLSDSTSTMEEVQAACSQLAKEYIDTAGILNNVNESNARLIESQLKEIGVTNADEIVQAKLNAARLNGILAANGLADATWEEVEAFLKESGAASSAIASLKQLKQEQYNAALATQDLISASTSSIAALINQANAAGVAAKSIAGLGKALKLKEAYAAGKLKGMTLSEYRDMMDSYSRQAQADISGISVTVPTVKVSIPKSSSSKSGSSGSSSSSASSKEIEAYIADIDKYRDAVERLRRVREEKEQIDRSLDNSEDLKEQILLERQLINAYQSESSSIQTLNRLRSDTINENAENLRKLGFEVQYNADTNELWISNLEHLNELTAKSKGKYDSLQEATNAIRKETEELIGATTSLNEENRDGADSIYELGVSVHDAKSQIVDDLKEIVSQASDAVDEIQNVYSTLKAAAEEYEQNGGYISIDTYQDIIDLGPQYMQYLKNENDLLVINEESINRVIEAKTRQLAAEQALTYVERLKAALQEGSIENMNTLLYATTDATEATFGFAYAELELMHQMGELDDTQYSAAMHNIDAIRSLCETAVGSIGKVSGAAEKAVEESRKQLESLRDELENMQDAGDDIIKYVMDMLKHRIQQQIDALEEMKDKYSEIIDLKKESLRASKEEDDYQKKLKSKLREMAKLQEKIDALSLDDSRSAQAERAKLLEDMAELQDDLNDTQAEKSIEVTEDALDKMEKSYHQEKDNEIKILEDSISSHQKLYDMAISYIRDHWDTLYSELISWNTEYGSVLNSEITEAWNNCQAAAERYGSFVSAMMGGIRNEIAGINAQIESLNVGGSVSGSASGSNSPNVVGKVDNNKAITNEDRAAAIIKRMYSNMNEHGGAGSSTSAARKAELSQENLRLGAQLSQYGISAYRSTDKEDYGTWYTDRTKREKLFDKYKRYIFHTGGVVGGGTFKDDEQLALLKNKEWVLSDRMVDTVQVMIERMKKLSEAFSNTPMMSVQSILPDFSRLGSSTVSSIVNNNQSNQPMEIRMGDINVYAQSDSAYVIADEVRKITRDNANELARLLKIRK